MASLRFVRITARPRGARWVKDGSFRPWALYDEINLEKKENLIFSES